ncbi:M43 family zinc metalloprotease [Adhaeribacter radiodurans]|uniref:M43 family zinc metalloprotease n=1 Tax=Adhaeribacter radiodurans TaxID=2745197 RepID=UPI0015FC114C|nr:M43 family zinc metalloprotease [Adhaeribacter radiodurans]
MKIISLRLTNSVCIIWLLLLAGTVMAQQPNPKPRCATNEVTQRLQQLHPDLLNQMQKAKKRAQKYRQQKKLARLQQPVTVVPVVFHVVYHTSQENISTEQILSQLEILNEDYRRLNADSSQTLPQFKGVAADSRIQFCLATRDPKGNPTTGVTRKFTSTTEFDQDDAVKFSVYGGQNAWDSERYLNIWVCNLQSKTLGYAQYPGSLAETDGVVLDYTTIGRAPANPFASRFNLGRTGTHEIAHWLGLQHIWGTNDTGSCNDSDDINDTPNQDKPSTGCPTGKVESCSNGSAGGNMYQNFLDYTDDACMNLFTQDQAEYMQSILSTVRQNILTTAVVCTSPLTADFEVSDTIIVAGTTVQFQDASIGVRANGWAWAFEGGNIATSTEQNPMVRYDQPGIYAVSFTASFSSISDAVTKTQYIRVTGTEPVIFPNPAQEQVSIVAPANKELQQVQIVNSVGQVVLTQAATDNFVLLKLPNLANGMYYCRLWYANKLIETKKLIISR